MMVPPERALSPLPQEEAGAFGAALKDHFPVRVLPACLMVLAVLDGTDEGAKLGFQVIDVGGAFVAGEGAMFLGAVHSATPK